MVIYIYSSLYVLCGRALSIRMLYSVGVIGTSVLGHHYRRLLKLVIIIGTYRRFVEYLLNVTCINELMLY